MLQFFYRSSNISLEKIYLCLITLYFSDDFPQSTCLLCREILTGEEDAKVRKMVLFSKEEARITRRGSFDLH